MASDEEDDYLTMTFEDPPPGSHPVETYSQRRARKLREHETNQRIKPAKELELERREEGLAKNLFADMHRFDTDFMEILDLRTPEVAHRIEAERAWTALGFRGRRWSAVAPVIVELLSTT